MLPRRQRKRKKFRSIEQKKHNKKINMSATKKVLRFEDGNLIIPSTITVHECMDFLHATKADCKDAPRIGTRWTSKDSILRIKVDKTNNEFLLKMSGSMIVLKPMMYGTINKFGMNQYGAGTAKASNKMEASVILDQGCSNFFFSLLHTAFHDSSMLKKTVWTSAEIEEYLKDNNIEDPRPYLSSKSFGFQPSDKDLPLNVPLITIPLSFWVHADKNIPEANRPRKSLGSSYYGGGPYTVSDGTITSGFLKFSRAVAPDFISRIEPASKMIRINKGDFANMCIRFLALPCIYSSAQKSDNTFPNVLSYSIRLGTFDVTLLVRTANAGGPVETSADDLERMKEMGGIVEPTESHHDGGDGGEDNDDELSETSREIKRQRTQ
jgi:hypothetical protein